MKDNKHNKWTIALACLIGLVFITGVLAPVNAQESDVSRKLSRKISVFERILSDVLHDSPYWLISGSQPAHGIYLDGFGVLFCFDASLVTNQWSMGRNFISSLRDYRINIDSNRYIILGDDDDDDDIEIYIDGDELDDMDKEEMEEYLADLKESRSKRSKKEARRYERGKEELMEMLIDYGDNLPGMKDSEWVAIAAFLDGDDFFEDNDCEHLVIKAKVGDLKAGLDEDELIKRIVVEEY
jgi:hypothetical protein